jgi:hypothetical protein
MKHILVPCFAAFGCLFINLSKAQTAAIDNKLSQTITFHSIPKGPSVYGVFEGRPPCVGIVKQLQISTDTNCEKLKWNIILYRDPLTLQPTDYILSMVGGGDIIKQEGSSYRQKIIKGKWAIIKGIRSNPDAEVYALQLTKSKSYLYLLKGDDNVLFILDENKELRVGNEDFSYTLNRVELVPGKK